MGEPCRLLGDGSRDELGARADVEDGDAGAEIDEGVPVDVYYDAAGRSLGKYR